MTYISMFDQIDEVDVKRMLNVYEAKKVFYKKGRTILSNMGNVSQIGIILNGSANITKFDYNGNRIILDDLEKNDIFGNLISSINSEDAECVTKENTVITYIDCEVLFIDYNIIMDKSIKGNGCYGLFVNNMFQILSSKIAELNNRVEVLTKRTSREKILKYFKTLSQNHLSDTFILPFSYTDLADYLAIDRSAMMRELKYLREEGFIKTDKKKITLTFP